MDNIAINDAPVASSGLSEEDILKLQVFRSLERQNITKTARLLEQVNLLAATETLELPSDFTAFLHGFAKSALLVGGGASVFNLIFKVQPASLLQPVLSSLGVAGIGMSFKNSPQLAVIKNALGDGKAELADMLNPLLESGNLQNVWENVKEITKHAANSPLIEPVKAAATELALLETARIALLPLANAGLMQGAVGMVAMFSQRRALTDFVVALRGGTAGLNRFFTRSDDPVLAEQNAMAEYRKEAAEIAEQIQANIIEQGKILGDLSKAARSEAEKTYQPELYKTLLGLAALPPGERASDFAGQWLAASQDFAAHLNEVAALPTIVMADDVPAFQDKMSEKGFLKSWLAKIVQPILQDKMSEKVFQEIEFIPEKDVLKGINTIDHGFIGDLKYGSEIKKYQKDELAAVIQQYGNVLQELIILRLANKSFNDSYHKHRVIYISKMLSEGIFFKAIEYEINALKERIEIEIKLHTDARWRGYENISMHSFDFLSADVAYRADTPESVKAFFEEIEGEITTKIADAVKQKYDAIETKYKKNQKRINPTDTRI